MLCDLYEEILCGMENSQDFLPFFDVALQQTLILLCTVHVNIKLKGGSANIMQPQNSIFYNITSYALDRQVNTCVLSQVYVTNQSKHQFLLINLFMPKYFVSNCQPPSAYCCSQFYAGGMHITR